MSREGQYRYREIPRDTLRDAGRALLWESRDS